MKETETACRAAEVYEQLFVPALFQQWGKVVTAAAAIGLGHRVLDVACGTGALARAAAERVGPDGMVVGLDASEEMLAVARRTAPASSGARDKPRRSLCR
jgi:ubiquinone/menaquinone biosynthesis C-methylase UbiE